MDGLKLLPPYDPLSLFPISTLPPYTLVPYLYTPAAGWNVLVLHPYNPPPHAGRNVLRGHHPFTSSSFLSRLTSDIPIVNG